ncbi:MAG: PIG-L family deacetylase [Planctomycetota bacterium]|jgi:bacillithiol biosynthesis deacetylase BshB1
MVDVLAIGAHPDDVEISAGGTLVKLRELGYSLALCAATDGEPTPHGSRETRLREADKVKDILGCEYEILDMPNRYLTDNVENRVKIATVIRKYRPSVIICPCTVGFHPDHKAVSNIVDAARFYAKLTKQDPAGNPWPHEPWWTPRQYYFFLGGTEEGVMPTFIVDVTDEYEKKKEVLACYASQWQVAMNRLSTSAHWGEMIGTVWGEAFLSKGPVGVDDLMMFTEKRGMPRKKPPDRGD